MGEDEVSSRVLFFEDGHDERASDRISNYSTHIKRVASEEIGNSSDLSNSSNFSGYLKTKLASLDQIINGLESQNRISDAILEKQDELSRFQEESIQRLETEMEVFPDEVDLLSLERSNLKELKRAMDLEQSNQKRRMAQMPSAKSCSAIPRTLPNIVQQIESFIQTIVDRQKILRESSEKVEQIEAQNRDDRQRIERTFIQKEKRISELNNQISMKKSIKLKCESFEIENRKLKGQESEMQRRIGEIDRQNQTAFRDKREASQSVFHLERVKFKIEEKKAKLDEHHGSLELRSKSLVDFRRNVESSQERFDEYASKVDDIEGEMKLKSVSFGDKLSESAEHLSVVNRSLSYDNPIGLEQSEGETLSRTSPNFL